MKRTRRQMHEDWNETLDEMKKKGWVPRSAEEEQEIRQMYVGVREMEEDETLRWRDVDSA